MVKIGSFLGLFLFFSHIAANAVNVETSVNKSQFYEDELIRLTISVENSEDVEVPSTFELKNFHIVGKSSSEQFSMSFINGKASRKRIKKIQLSLATKKIGILNIEPIKISVGGKSVWTQSLKVKILKGKSPVKNAVNGVKIFFKPPSLIEILLKI